MSFLRFLFSHARAAGGVLAAAIVAGILSGASSVGLLALINRALRDEAGLTGAGLAFVALCICVTVSRVASHFLLERLSQGTVIKLRLELIDRILSAPLRSLEQLGPNRLLAALTHDVAAITQALTTIPLTSINGTIVVGCFGYLAYLDARLFLLLSGVIVVGTLSYQLPARMGIRRFREAREQQDTLYEHFRALSDGVKELKLHRQRQRQFVGLVRSTSDFMRHAYERGTLILSSAEAWGHLLFFVVIGTLLFVNPTLIGADAETLMGYTIVLLYMMSPMHGFLNSIPTLGRASVAVNKIEALGLSLPGEAASSAPALSGEQPWQGLELRGITHSYQRSGKRSDQDRTFTLGPVDLTLTPGRTLFIVGGNGSGKTTLAKILVGLYGADSGDLLLNGRTVTDRDDVRQLFSVVFNDFYLFDSLLGLESANLDAEARHYLQELRLDHKVDVHEGRFSTLELSQGQRKRLALLTAYLEDRPIYLFDEWAADQDPVFKEFFYYEILTHLKRKNKGVVVISHDERYFHLADQVLKLEDGKVGAESLVTSA